MKKYKFTADVTYEATSHEDALQKFASHIAMLARFEGNGMKVAGGKLTGDFMQGDIKLTEEGQQDQPGAAGIAGGAPQPARG